MADKKRSFADLKQDNYNWITLATGEFYPDILAHACDLYEPVLRVFDHLLKSSESSGRLLIQISEQPETWIRTQLCRVFRKYVSPNTSVEMLKVKSRAVKIVEEFGENFRPINEVQEAFNQRPIPDEALCAVLWEYRTRGQSGYDLTERFFALFRKQYPNLIITGPERAGHDIRLGSVFRDYPNPTRPVDFVVRSEEGGIPLVIGLARYDSDRGGSQEDDRLGGYRNCADEILAYADEAGLNTKLVFLNDGPGLLLGSMWDDYAALEESWPGRILVLTLRMVPERLGIDWMTA